MITFASGCGERRARLQLAAGAAGHDEAGAGPGEQQLHRPRALGELAAGVPQLGRALGRLSGLRARYLHREVIHQNIEGKWIYYTSFKVRSMYIYYIGHFHCYFLTLNFINSV